MKVLITRYTKDKSWYRNRIGEEFYVLKANKKGQHLVDASKYPEDHKFLSGFYILSDDCVIINNEKEEEEIIKEDDLYQFSCCNCDWIFKAKVNKKLNCEYCLKEIITNPFNESDEIGVLGSTSFPFYSNKF